MKPGEGPDRIDRLVAEYLDREGAGVDGAALLSRAEEQARRRRRRDQLRIAVPATAAILIAAALLLPPGKRRTVPAEEPSVVVVSPAASIDRFRTDVETDLAAALRGATSAGESLLAPLAQLRLPRVPAGLTTTMNLEEER